MKKPTIISSADYMSNAYIVCDHNMHNMDNTPNNIKDDIKKLSACAYIACGQLLKSCKRIFYSCKQQEIKPECYDIANNKYEIFLDKESLEALTSVLSILIKYANQVDNDDRYCTLLFCLELLHACGYDRENVNECYREMVSCVNGKVLEAERNSLCERVCNLFCGFCYSLKSGFKENELQKDVILQKKEFSHWISPNSPCVNVSISMLSLIGICEFLQKIIEETKKEKYPNLANICCAAQLICYQQSGICKNGFNEYICQIMKCEDQLNAIKLARKCCLDFLRYAKQFDINHKDEKVNTQDVKEWQSYVNDETQEIPRNMLDLAGIPSHITKPNSGHVKCYLNNQDITDLFHLNK